MVNVNGVRTTTNIEQARRVVDMADKIALLDPNESPFVTFLKLASRNKRKVYNPKFDWLEDDLVGNSTTVATAIAAADTTTLVVADGSIFKAGDVLSVPAVGENMLVTAVSTNSLTVVRGYGTGAAAASISVDAVVLRIGTAMPENSSVPAAISTQEVDVYNYTQIFRTPLILSGTEAASKLYGGKDLAYQRRKAAIEHKRDMARAMYFGQKKQDTSGTTVRRTMAGLDSFMTDAQTVAFDSTYVPLTYRNFDNYVAQKAFSHGSSEKLLIAGPYLASAINSWAEKKLVTKVDKSATYGIRVKNLVTSYGDFKVIYDPLLADGAHAGYGYVIDTDNVRYAYLDGRDTKLNIGIQAPDVDGIIDEYITECSLEVKLPKTHMRITGAYALSE